MTATLVASKILASEEVRTYSLLCTTLDWNAAGEKGEPEGMERARGVSARGWGEMEGVL